jgi:hypothetical protein
MVVSMKMAVFWVVVPCSHIAMMMEAAGTSETLVNFYQTTWHYNPEDSHLRWKYYLKLLEMFSHFWGVYCFKF